MLDVWWRLRVWASCLLVLCFSAVGSAHAEENPFGPLDDACDPADPSCMPDPGEPASVPAPEVIGGTDSGAPELGASGALSLRDVRRSRDASVDRSFLTPSAETLGQGDWSINSYELLFLGATYGITDGLQVSLTTLLPVIPYFPGMYLLGVKGVAWSSERDVLSVGGSMLGAISHEAKEGILTGGAALYYDRILGAEGGSRFSATLGSQTLLATGQGNTERSTVFYLSTAFFAYVSDRLQLGAELSIPTLNNPGSRRETMDVWDDGFGQSSPFDLLLLTAGLRITTDKLSVDLALTRPITPGDEGAWFAIPFVAVSARF